MYSLMHFLFRENPPPVLLSYVTLKNNVSHTTELLLYELDGNLRLQTILKKELKSVLASILDIFYTITFQWTWPFVNITLLSRTFPFHVMTAQLFVVYFLVVLFDLSLNLLFNKQKFILVTMFFPDTEDKTSVGPGFKIYFLVKMSLPQKNCCIKRHPTCQVYIGQFLLAWGLKKKASDQKSMRK